MPLIFPGGRNSGPVSLSPSLAQRTSRPTGSSPMLARVCTTSPLGSPPCSLGPQCGRG